MRGELENEVLLKGRLDIVQFKRLNALTSIFSGLLPCGSPAGDGGRGVEECSEEGLGQARRLDVRVPLQVYLTANPCSETLTDAYVAENACVYLHYLCLFSIL
jgi:hypothetical protein